VGYTGKKINTVVSIGIGGSYLGPEFVYEALKTSPVGKVAAGDMKLKFLANVDPIDFSRALEGVDVETSLFIIVSKTFTTAETMLNARQARTYIQKHYEKTKSEGFDSDSAIAAHMCAVSTNLNGTKAFGLKEERVFGFWDWVGGRFSVSSAVGLLPLSLIFGFQYVELFLSGMHEVDVEFSLKSDNWNVPAFLGLIGFYNTYICGIESRAILPYC
jgi:glucose-6-phosphate isomerase